MCTTIYLFRNRAPLRPLRSTGNVGSYYNDFMIVCHGLSAMKFQGNRVLSIESVPLICYRVIVVLFLFLCVLPSLDSRVWAQSISSVRSFDGGVTPLFTLPGP